jgi:hypothetical protein
MKLNKKAVILSTILVATLSVGIIVYAEIFSGSGTVNYTYTTTSTTPPASLSITSATVDGAPCNTVTATSFICGTSGTVGMTDTIDFTVGNSGGMSASTTATETSTGPATIGGFSPSATQSVPAGGSAMWSFTISSSSAGSGAVTVTITA